MEETNIEGRDGCEEGEGEILRRGEKECVQSSLRMILMFSEVVVQYRIVMEKKGMGFGRGDRRRDE